MWRSIGYEAKRQSVTTQTIRTWISEGRYEPQELKKTKGGHYRIWVETEPRKIFYAKDAEGEKLRSRFSDYEFIHDIGSGCDRERYGFRAILESALNGIPQEIVVASEGQFTECGFPLVKRIIELAGGQVICLEKDCEEEFDVDQFITILSKCCDTKA